LSKLTNYKEITRIETRCVVPLRELSQKRCIFMVAARNGSFIKLNIIIFPELKEKLHDVYFRDDEAGMMKVNELLQATTNKSIKAL
jgi:hypothetical protein